MLHFISMVPSILLQQPETNLETSGTSTMLLIISA